MEIRPGKVNKRGQIGMVIVHHDDNFVAGRAGVFGGDGWIGSIVAGSIVAGCHPAHLGIVCCKIGDAIGGSICVFTGANYHIKVSRLGSEFWGGIVGEN